MIFYSKYPNSTPPEKYGNSLAQFYWEKLDQFQEKTLFIDYESKREWTGKQIKLKATQLAEVLVNKLHLKTGSCCYFFAQNNDYLQLAALGCILAGGSVCVSPPGEPKTELVYMTSQTQPKVIFVASGEDCEVLIDIIVREQIDGANLTICILSDDCTKSPENLLKHNIKHLLLHKDIWIVEGGEKDDMTIESLNQRFKPPKVNPDQPAYVLFTSGSTGLPKPVARTHKNCLHVAHCLDTTGNELWDLSEKSVMAGHLQLDHGTGTFSIKMCLSKGYTLIIMDGYDFDRMSSAISEYKITDCMLGSALLHQFITRFMDLQATNQEDKSIKKDISSLRNLIAVGSPIASHKITGKFMDLYPEVSIRQAFGMTEVGFTSIVARQECRIDTRSVGYLLPNLQVRLVNRYEQREKSEIIMEPNIPGELQIRGPTTSPGYTGQKYSGESQEVFLQDGFYRSADIASMTSDGKLTIHGRFSDVMCLYDGWKVLPQEIEACLSELEEVKEVGVIGVPNPDLPTCQMARAYIVPKSRRLTPAIVQAHTQKNLSEFKQLSGGIVILSQEEQLPRGSLQKLDRKRLHMRYKTEVQSAA